MNCIFCGQEVKKPSIEHIVPESLGNKLYTLEIGSICGDCNNRFSKFEAKAIPNTILGHERSRLNVETKKGKPGSGHTGHLKTSAMPSRGKNFINMEGLEKEDVVKIHPDGKTFEVLVPGFNKDSEVATAKLLLKIGFESIYQSRRALFENYDFTDLKRYLTTQDNADWPFITTQTKLDQFTQIPKQNDITRLKYKECTLMVAELDNELLFRFQYGGAIFIINLLGRDIKWIQRYIDADNNSMAYPAAMRKKFTGLKEKNNTTKAVVIKPTKETN